MNKIVELLRAGFQGKLLVGKMDTPSTMAGTTMNVALPIGTNKMLLKSIEVTANKNINFEVEFFEDPNSTDSKYNSGPATIESYDVLDLPYIDKLETGNMYISIHNESDVDVIFSIEVRGIELK